MIRLASVVAATVVCTGSQLGAQVPVSTKAHAQGDYLAWVTQLETAPHISLPPAQADSARSKRYRLAVLTSEIYSTVLIEEVRFGTEGCCARLASVRELDLAQMARGFGLRGEIAGVRVVRAQSPTSFQITMHGRTFDLQNIDESTIRVVEVR